MKSLALRGMLRRAVTRLHRWTGLVIMACLLVAAVTGTWLTFRIEMDRLVNPGLRTVQPRAARVTLASIVDAIERRFPNASVHTLILQDRGDDSISAYLDSNDGSRLELDRVFYDPYTGAFLGGSNTRELVFKRSNVDSLVDRLHYSLWINSWGLELMGVVAGVWLLTSVIGLALAWPAVWLRIRCWAPILSVRADRGAYQANYRAHRAFGVWFFPVLLVLAFTSFYQNMPQYVRPVVNALSPLSERPAGKPLPEGAPMITPDRALESLRVRYPSAQPDSIGVDRRSGRYSILFKLPGDLSDNGDNWAFVDLVSGGIIGEKIDRTSGAGDRFLTWIFPLHTGVAFGMPGRIVIAIAGVGLIGMMLTGLYVWGTKWRMRRSATMRTTIGTAVVILFSIGLQAQVSGGPQATALASAKNLRCAFQVTASGTWETTGSPKATVKPATLVLLFESIDTDEGTARLRFGSVGNDVVAKLSGGYLHFMQSFRSGPLYTTTVFDKQTSAGKFKAVHSRHEYFTIPVPGATSSPEQYYGECEIRP